MEPVSTQTAYAALLTHTLTYCSEYPYPAPRRLLSRLLNHGTLLTDNF